MAASFEQLEQWANSYLDDAHSAAVNDNPEAVSVYIAKGQTQALLAVGVAIKDLANAIREKR